MSWVIRVRGTGYSGKTYLLQVSEGVPRYEGNGVFTCFKRGAKLFPTKEAAITEAIRVKLIGGDLAGMSLEAVEI